MQPGYPGSGQEPYGTQPPYRDPYAQPHYSSGPQDERNTSLPADDQPEAGQELPYAAAPIPPVAVPPQRPAAAPAPPPTSTNANTVGLIGMVLGVLSVP